MRIRFLPASRINKIIIKYSNSQPTVQPRSVKLSLYLFSQNKNPGLAKTIRPLMVAEIMNKSKNRIGPSTPIFEPKRRSALNIKRATRPI